MHRSSRPLFASLTMFRLFSTAALSLLSSAVLGAGTFRFEVKTDRPAIDYPVGEPITFTVRLLEDDKPASGHRIAWLREGDDGLVEKGEGASNEPLTLVTRAGKPGFIRLKLSARDAAGAVLKNGDKDVAYTAGAAAAPDRIEVAPEPADFDAFWTQQKARLAEVPVQEIERVAIPSKTQGVAAYDLKIACAGPKPVTGYLCLPDNARPKSLPAKIVFFGYGVYPTSMIPAAERPASSSA